ncbi:MAG TPA: carboxypeptidase-like regulatory domain-containing protein [Acidobacteriaceae bacterium]
MQETSRTSYRWVTWRCLTALSLATAALPASAQYCSGIEGTVVDSNGAAIPSAQVTLSNQETHVQQAAVAHGQGMVQIMHLAPGRYNMTVTATGFSSWQQNGIDRGNRCSHRLPKIAARRDAIHRGSQREFFGRRDDERDREPRA